MIGTVTSIAILVLWCAVLVWLDTVARRESEKATEAYRQAIEATKQAQRDWASAIEARHDAIQYYERVQALIAAQSAAGVTGGEGGR